MQIDAMIFPPPCFLCNRMSSIDNSITDVCRIENDVIRRKTQWFLIESFDIEDDWKQNLSLSLFN